MFYCTVCEKDVERPDHEWVGADASGYVADLCPTCGEEIVESYDCPVHGTDAPDGFGNCAKC